MLPLNNELESCWCQKLLEHTKIILHPKFERKRILGRYFTALWFFSEVVGFVLLISCSTFHSYAQMCCKCYHIIFSTFSLKFKCKICVQREVIHNFKKHILVTWPFTNLFILRKWCGFENQMTITLFKIWPTNRFSKAKSCNFHFHKNDVTCLLVQMAY